MAKPTAKLRTAAKQVRLFECGPRTRSGLEIRTCSRRCVNCNGVPGTEGMPDLVELEGGRAGEGEDEKEFIPRRTTIWLLTLPLLRENKMVLRLH